MCQQLLNAGNPFVTRLGKARKSTFFSIYNLMDAGVFWASFPRNVDSLQVTNLGLFITPLLQLAARYFRSLL